MPDVDAIGRLARALRAVPEDRPYDVPGDGRFVWDFGEYLLDEAALPEAFREHPEYEGLLRGRGLGEGFCGSVGCAMGLAKLMGLVDRAGTLNLAEALGIPVGDAVDLFLEPSTYGFGRPGQRFTEDFDRVTPTMVADELERRYLTCPT